MVWQLRDLLERAGYENLNAIPRARVPILKAVDGKTRPTCAMEVDICINNILAVHNTQLLRTYALLDKRARALVIAVKDWAKRENIAAASDGTLSSYSWTILVLHYLQNRRSGAAASLGEAKDAPLCEIPVLPCLQDPAMLEVCALEGNQYGSKKKICMIAVCWQAWRAAGAPGAGKDALMGQRGDNINVGLKSNSAWPE